ncbi:MAG TPA: bifunctional riboflavin kinase/FAD synthetase [Geobacteraceae bacterium]
MVIYRTLDEIRERLPRAVATIGNFDGVHLGHREIFRRVKRSAAARGGVSAVITFVPHPLKVLPAGRELRLINTYAEKELLIEASGVDYLIIIPFTPEFAAISAESFVRDILVGKIGIEELVIGYDYAFGRNREGNTALLAELGKQYGFVVDVLSPLGDGSVVYSSSAIRRLIAAGDVRGVVPLLGRHFSVGGSVVHGHHRGRGLGFPTANLSTDKELIPLAGVYAVKVKIDNDVYDGACNIGTNPTFGDDAMSIEVFLFDFADDLYGRELRLYFVDRIREEKRFSDPATLQEAIATDVARCRELLAGVTIIEYREYLGGDCP